MAERLLISKLKRTSATQAELYGARHRYPDLKLFDLAELGAVGVDFEALPIGEERPARFWAVYELSSKTNKAGRPYKDIVALEPMAGPATAASLAADAGLLGELRAIRAVLVAMAEASGIVVPTEAEAEPADDGDGDPGELNRSFPRFGDGTAVPDAALPFYQEYLQDRTVAPANVDDLRAWTQAQKRKAPARNTATHSQGS